MGEEGNFSGRRIKDKPLAGDIEIFEQAHPPKHGSKTVGTANH
jgi:hypothetical protein